MRSHVPLRAQLVAILALLVGFLGLGVGPASAYYEESHLTSDEVRITVDSVGVARVEHTLAWRIVAGKPRNIDLLGTEPSAIPDPATTLECEDGRMLNASVAVLPGKGVRVTVLEPKGLHHGLHYQLKVAYTVNLVDAGELTRDGPSFRLVWKAPPPQEGYERPRVTFFLPPTLEPPAALVGEGAMPDDGVSVTLRRSPEHDELELLRPHIGRAEETTWAVRIGAKAFDAGRSAAFGPPPPPPRRDEPPGPAAPAYGVVLFLAVLVASGVRFRERRLLAESRAEGYQAAPRGILPLRSWERASLVGALLFVGISLQLVDAPLVGATAVVLAMVAASVRMPDLPVVLRGPGRWLVLRPDEAFPAKAGRDVLKTLAWGLVVLAAVGAFVAAGRLLVPIAPDASILLPLDSLILLPLLATGTSRGPASHRARAERWLSRLFLRLRSIKPLRVSPWARVPSGASSPDEVRLLVAPREPMPGLVSIEVGVAPGRCVWPEVLVRVETATAASARMTSLLPDRVPSPGRKPEERVFRIRPRVPTTKSAALLVRSLAVRLVDRRFVSDEWEGEERRVLPGAREEPTVAVAAVAS